MSKFITDIINLGIHTGLSFNEQKKVKILNTICLFWFITAFGGNVFLLINQDFIKFFYNVPDFLVIFLCFWAQYKRRYVIARLIVMIYNTGSVFLIASIFPEMGIEHFFIAFFILPMVFFDKSYIIVPMMILIFTAFAILKIPQNSGLHQNMTASILYFVSLLISFFMAYLVLLIFKREHYSYEKIIEENNSLLQSQKEEIKTTLELVELERQKSDNLLLNILPEETAAELKTTGTATPQHYELVSVLFTDFQGFTQAVEHLKPIEVIKELDFCFNKFDEIIEKYGLERIKTIGDAYMAVGGLPIANQTNPIDAVKAGIEIQAFMNNLKQQRESEGKTAWQCRLGIHSGEVIAGVVGTKKFAYDIWGDTVNLASRMESSGEAGKVNISGTTYQLVKDKFQCTYRGKIEAKNKGEVEMYFVEKEL